jgi:hypothetical protein
VLTHRKNKKLFRETLTHPPRIFQEMGREENAKLRRFLARSDLTRRFPATQGRRILGKTAVFSRP